MNEIRCMSRKGDIKLSWNSDNNAEIIAAREMFNKYVNEEKWSAFGEKKSGCKGEKIKKFDKCMERIILVPPISGG